MENRFLFYFKSDKCFTERLLRKLMEKPIKEDQFEDKKRLMSCGFYQPITDSSSKIVKLQKIPPLKNINKSDYEGSNLFISKHWSEPDKKCNINIFEMHKDMVIEKQLEFLHKVQSLLPEDQKTIETLVSKSRMIELQPDELINGDFVSIKNDIFMDDSMFEKMKNGDMNIEKEEKEKYSLGNLDLKYIFIWRLYCSYKDSNYSDMFSWLDHLKHR